MCRIAFHSTFSQRKPAKNVREIGEGAYAVIDKLKVWETGNCQIYFILHVYLQKALPGSCPQNLDITYLIWYRYHIYVNTQPKGSISFLFLKCGSYYRAGARVVRCIHVNMATFHKINLTTRLEKYPDVVVRCVLRKSKVSPYLNCHHF